MNEIPDRRGPRDSAAYKRDRRAAVLKHHPDHGGSAEELIKALEDVDRKHGVINDPAAARAAAAESAEKALAVLATTLAGVVAIGASIAVSVLRRRG